MTRPTSSDPTAFDVTLSAVLATALDATIGMREDGTVVAWNGAAEATFGWTSAQVQGRQLADLIIPPEFQARHHRGLEQYLRTGIPKSLGKHVEVSAINRAGLRFPAELSTTEIEHGGKRIFIGFIRDITQREEAKLKITEITERLELAIRAHSIGIFDTDPSTGTVHFNEELEKIYGYGPGEFKTALSAWRHHVLPGDLARIDADLAQALQAKSSELSYSYRMRRCDGELRYIEASSKFFYDREGKNIRRVGVNIDVTERKTAERRLAETQAELFHVSRLNSLGAMASSLSHELSQPLQSVANYISAAEILLVSDEAPEIDNLLEVLKLAAEGTQRVGSLIKRLRVMSGKGTICPQNVSLSLLLDNTAPLVLHDVSSTDIVLVKTIDPEADAAFGDPILLQQVIFNLLRNAAEAMSGAGGTINVRAIRRSVHEIVVEVEDAGVGFDEGVASNLFTPFMSTKTDGMGVGLSICRTIVEKSGGQIWATSGEGRTSFFFTLPTGPSPFHTSAETSQF